MIPVQKPGQISKMKDHFCSSEPIVFSLKLFFFKKKHALDVANLKKIN